MPAWSAAALLISVANELVAIEAKEPRPNAAATVFISERRTFQPFPHVTGISVTIAIFGLFWPEPVSPPRASTYIDVVELGHVFQAVILKDPDELLIT